MKRTMHASGIYNSLQYFADRTDLGDAMYCSDRIDGIEICCLDEEFDHMYELLHCRCLEDPPIDHLPWVRRSRPSEQALVFSGMALRLATLHRQQDQSVKIFHLGGSYCVLHYCAMQAATGLNAGQPINAQFPIFAILSCLLNNQYIGNNQAESRRYSLLVSCVFCDE